MTNHFSEYYSIPASPRPSRARCDACDEEFGADDDLRIPYHHERAGNITICERCDRLEQRARTRGEM